LNEFVQYTNRDKHVVYSKFKKVTQNIKNMEEKFLATMVTSFTKILITESKELFSDIYDQVYDETKQFIGKDLKRYLTKQQDKYSHIKTLLRGNTPVFLYDIYFPLKLTCDKGIISTQSIRTVFENSNYITIIGDAGSGKSTLVKHLYLNTIKEKYKIPILVELRYLNNIDLSFEEYIRSITSLNKISVNQDILNRFFEKGKFVFFLDGYDELDEEISILLDQAEFNGADYHKEVVNRYIDSQTERKNKISKEWEEKKKLLLRDTEACALFNFRNQISKVESELKDIRSWKQKAKDAGLSEMHEFIYDYTSALMHSTSYAVLTPHQLDESEITMILSLATRLNSDILKKLKSFAGVPNMKVMHIDG